MTLTIRQPNEPIVVIPIQAELLHGVSAVPPRCETFRVFHIDSHKFPCVVESQKIEENVIVPTTVVYEPKSWIRVLNTDECIKVINTEKLRISATENFHILQYDKMTNHTNNRLEMLQNKLKKKTTQFMRNKLTDLCMEFSDIFHVEGDRSSVNNFYKQKIGVTDNEPVYTKNYRLPYAQKTEIDRQVKILLENDDTPK